jgi:DNA-binding transcriptional LysR family regulator
MTAMKRVRWHELEFRHLEYAIAVKKYQGVTPAAIALDLDQGFLSKQIQRLEASLGFRLFDRRPLKLTEAGQIFLARAEQIVEQAKKAVELAQETQAGKRGRLDVGINTSIANSKLPDVVREFCRQFPDVNLVLHELASYVQIEQLRNHQIDIGFFHRHNLRGADQENIKALKLTSVLHESLVVVLPKTHRFAKRSSVSLAKLSGERFVLPPSTLLYGLREQIDQLCARANCKSIVVQEAAWITTVLSLVAGGMGISLLPANVRNLQRAGVVYCDIQELTPVLEIIAVQRFDNPSATLKNFLEVVGEVSRHQD